MNIVILCSANECKIVIMYAGILHHTTGIIPTGMDIAITPAVCRTTRRCEVLLLGNG